jgi:hypothetical protein
MTAGPHPELADPAVWSTAAADLMADLGFSLVNGDDPWEAGGANLLVAIRAAPTLVHFDPESMECWRFDGERGVRLLVDRETPGPGELPIAWGRIRIEDRLGVTNDFLSFGGRLRIADQDGTRLIQVHAPAPILRWAGHSQGLDPLTDEVGAFFGRIMIPIDFTPGAEQAIGTAGPLVLYAAFVDDAWQRFASTQRRREAEPQLAGWARTERHRLEARHPDAVGAARRLLGRLGLASTNTGRTGAR